MRIIAGWLGGRHFDSPHGHRTHPMSDKVRGALFNALGDIEGLSVLDAFAGSGALSFEAVSRGASAVIAVDADKNAHQIIKSNLKELGIEDRVSVTRAFAGAWSTRHQKDMFDLILLDPPYDNIPYRDLERLPRHLKDGGTLVLSWPGKAGIINLPRFTDLQIVQQKDYGDAELVFYRRTQ